ncbi:MAG: hypothetical protein ABI091_12785 [Ferruginibacter sp.]
MERDYFNKIFVVAILIMFCACTTQKKDSIILEILNSGLQNSSQEINRQTIVEYKSLTDKLSDPVTMEKAAIWLPKAQLSEKLSNNLEKKLDSIKSTLNTSDLNSDSLYDDLTSYKNDILRIDPKINHQFYKEINQVSQLNNSLPDSKKVFINTVSNITVRNEKIALLSKIQNSISLIENKISVFCNLQTAPGWNLGFNKISTIVSQNTNHLKSGETLEIYAGVGAFSTVPNPVISINDSQVKIGEDGLSVYKMKVQGAVGKYSASVKINYTGPDGEKMSKTNFVYYYIDK